MFAAGIVVVLAIAGCGGERPATITIESNQKVTLETDAVQGGDKIVCVLGGAPMGAVVPSPGQGVGGASGSAPRQGVASINVSNEDGTVTATCAGG